LQFGLGKCFLILQIMVLALDLFEGLAQDPSSVTVFHHKMSLSTRCFSTCSMLIIWINMSRQRFLITVVGARLLRNTCVTDAEHLLIQLTESAKTGLDVKNVFKWIHLASAIRQSKSTKFGSTRQFASSPAQARTLTVK